MNRRRMLILLISTVLMGVNGCPRKSLDELVRTLGDAVSKLAAMQGDAELAQRIKQHTDYAVGLIRMWKPGMNAVDVIRALNEIISDLEKFPQLDRFRPLIYFTLGTIANIIERLQAQGAGGEPPQTRVRLTQPPTSAQEFRTDWDAIRRGSPDLQQAPVL